MSSSPANWMMELADAFIYQVFLALVSLVNKKIIYSMEIFNKKKLVRRQNSDSNSSDKEDSIGIETTKIARIRLCRYKWNAFD